MALPRMHDDREYCLYHNDLGQPIGECALEVRGWLADHPDYQGWIWGDWDLGSPRDHFDATEIMKPTIDEHGNWTTRPAAEIDGDDKRVVRARNV